jgi:transposase
MNPQASSDINVQGSSVQDGGVQDNVLFADSGPQPSAGKKPIDLSSPPRLRRADRSQVLLQPRSLDELLSPEHDARVVWQVVCSWNLSRFLARIAARGEAPGRAATDPRILISLWLYAYTQGISNARELWRRCESDDAFRWLAGAVSLNYHTISDFRVDHEAALDDLLSQMIAALLAAGAIEVHRISQDGTRVRACAGASSFKTKDTLDQHLKAAQEHVRILKSQAQDPSVCLQQQKAIERAAVDKAQRLQQALVEVQKVQQAKEQQKPKASKDKEAKASMTDPEARVMKMPDGGFAPAYNVQFAVATQGRAIVGVAVTNEGNDVHQSRPLRQQVQNRTGRKVDDHLVDGGYIGLEAVDAAAEDHTTLYAPVPRSKKEGVDPHQPKKGDSPAVIDWRARMTQAVAQAIYKDRCSTVETVNAECKSYRGLKPFAVRGLHKTGCVALWVALAYNFVHFGQVLLTMS